MDLQDLRQKTVDWYAHLAMQKGWVAYAKHQVLEMEKDKSGLWDGLYTQVKQRIEELKKCTS